MQIKIILNKQKIINKIVTKFKINRYKYFSLFKKFKKQFKLIKKYNIKIINYKDN